MANAEELKGYADQAIAGVSDYISSPINDLGLLADGAELLLGIFTNIEAFGSQVGTTVAAKLNLTVSLANLFKGIADLRTGEIGAKNDVLSALSGLMQSFAAFTTAYGGSLVAAGGAEAATGTALVNVSSKFGYAGLMFSAGLLSSNFFTDQQAIRMAENWNNLVDGIVDTAEAQAKLIELLTDPDFWEALGRAGRKELEQLKGKLREELGQGEPLSTGLLIPLDPTPQPLEDAKEKMDTGSTIPSPIILDLDGDGVETTTTNRGTYFDHNANGYAELTGWVGKDDALLVRDLNNNGKIDSGRELFGSETLLANGTKAQNGFAALAELDLAINGGNADGKIDAQDTAFASLNIWQDANSDGVTDAGELKTLAELGVQSISLDYNNTNYTISNPGFGNSNIGYQTDNNGNEHRQLGSYTKLNADGSTSTQAATDVWFKANPLDSITTNPLAISDEIAALPNIQGYGNLKDLHQAMNDEYWRVVA